ncbi:glycosyltransferase family 9 protein [uncultured Ferrovibrio sp.]|jgi:ADP-heptose:LPS heptosyltransferase|uniref:glycosyltransferase family 9 protein n=1 Tax=uncultured Ferrovibrio sp. TaxID=1576913 RepID=UPI0026175B5A|nr:glycosyltransferase family 9 protein [uncultured Ferrovibrio sp.]
MSILVIKHSALGDMILALPLFRAIRRHHPDEHLVLLTTAPYVDLIAKSSYFDEIWCDSRPKLWQLRHTLNLIRRIRGGRFSRIYDLQGSQRTRWYYRLLGRPRPEWVGNAPGCSHFIPDSTVPIHISELRRQQLALVGIPDPGLPDLSFLQSDITRYGLRQPFALLVPGGSPHRPQKRWPAAHFAALANHLQYQGLQPVLIGRQAERLQIDEILAACPQAISLYEQTSIADLATLGRQAAVAVGNDTGPMHVLAAAGCPSLVLYSAESDPRKVSPRGDWVRILQHPNLANLSLEKVLKRLPPQRS